jgi:hypothetical protein
MLSVELFNLTIEDFQSCLTKHLTTFIVENGERMVNIRKADQVDIFIRLL